MLFRSLDGTLLSPEARLAVAAYADVADRLPHVLTTCASGRELAAQGFGADVAAAAARDVTGVVPRLVDGAFTAVP